MILLVLNKVEQCSSVLDAWDAAGVPGITILESTGLGHIKSSIRDDLPLMPSIASLLRGREENHRTLFTVVEEADVDHIIDVLGTIEHQDETTGVIHVKSQKTGKILKVADLVNDNPKSRDKISTYLREVKSPEDIDIIIALGMELLFDLLTVKLSRGVILRSRLTKV